MKNLRKYGLLLFFIRWGFALEAQELVSSFLDEYGKDNRLEVVTIGRKMLDRMSGLSSGQEEDLAELQAAIKGLENLCIVTSKDTVLNGEYYASCRQMLKDTGFNVIFSGNENADELFVVGTKESKGAVKELALLFLDKNGRFNLIQMTGVIDIDTLVKYSEKLKELDIHK